MLTIHYPALELFRHLVRHRRLSWELAKKDLRDRYAGQLLGGLWILIHPAIQVGTLVFVYSIVFKTRIAINHEMPRDYTAYILSGLIPWLGVADTVGRASVTITSKTSLVKQVVFPIEILPVTSVIVGLIPQAICLLILLGYILATDAGLTATLALLPALLLLQSAFLLGITYALSAVSVYVRDLKDVVAILLNLGIYGAPVVYLPSWVPEMFRPLLYLNPFSYLIWCYQDVFYFGRIQHPEIWYVQIILSGVVLIGGYMTFRKLKPYFGSAL